ncbi:MAG: hypothetical protein RLZ98_399 [Pseudomonadota bacterium]|jgi:phosphoribosyl-ATP pyrophosphohydrolase
MSKTVVLERLVETIRARKAADAEKSYTKSLLDGGVDRCAKKFGEEAVETIIAAASQSDEALAGEAADVLFHLLVLLECRGVDFERVLETLEQRQGVSGHAEKAQRSK